MLYAVFTVHVRVHVCDLFLWMHLGAFVFVHRPNYETQTNEQLNLETLLISPAVLFQLPGGRVAPPHRCRGTATAEVCILQGELQYHDHKTGGEVFQ